MILKHYLLNIATWKVCYRVFDMKLTMESNRQTNTSCIFTNK